MKKNILNFKFSIFNQEKGFTLIELIVVTGILGILAAVFLTSLDPIAQIRKANDAKRKSDLTQIQKSLENYYQDNARYPAIFAASDYRIKDAAGNVVDWGKSWNPYMNVLPKDPASNKKYAYYSTPNGQAYYLYATLDISKDPQACKSGQPCDSLSANGMPANACNANCNYGVSSPNVSP